MALLWALLASLALFLLAAMNLCCGPGEKGTPGWWISFAGCVVWVGFVLRFAKLIGKVFDFRPIVNLIIR